MLFAFLFPGCVFVCLFVCVFCVYVVCRSVMFLSDGMGRREGVLAYGTLESFVRKKHYT